MTLYLNGRFEDGPLEGSLVDVECPEGLSVRTFEVFMLNEPPDGGWGAYEYTQRADTVFERIKGRLSHRELSAGPVLPPGTAGEPMAEFVQPGGAILGGPCDGGRIGFDGLAAGRWVLLVYLLLGRTLPESVWHAHAFDSSRPVWTYLGAIDGHPAPDWPGA